MVRHWWLIIICAAVGQCSAQTDLAPDTLLLARIKTRMSAILGRQPNYTCTQTVERSNRNGRSHKFRLLDTLRLEVALVNGKELYAWPGASKFEHEQLSDLISGGAFGNGNFALFARSVFTSSAPSFQYVGVVQLNAKPAIKYDYRVSLMNSGYTIRANERQALVGYFGSFWVDPESLDLRRLDVNVNEIPVFLGVSSSSVSLEYRRSRIGASDFLLPHYSDFIMTDLTGGENHNRTFFSGCRQYTGESILSFDEIPADPDVPLPKKVLREVAIPAELDVEVSLNTPIDSEASAVGDPVQAVVSRNVKQHGEVVVPKGAILTGRITQLQKRDSDCILAIEFNTVEWTGNRGLFTAKLQYAGPFNGTTSNLQPGTAFGRGWAPTENHFGGVNAFQLRATKFKLQPRFRMIWRTQKTSI